MRRNLLVILVLLLGATTMQAKPVDVATAQRLGQNFVQNKAMFAKTANPQLDLAYTCRTENGMATAYVFNLSEGFVILSADDCYHPILGYAYQGHFDYDNAPDGMRYMLSELSNDIARCVSENIPATSLVVCEWKNLETSGQLHPAKSVPVVDVLIRQRWDQGSPYNMYVPSGCPTGCVATAMAQLMKYWEWPVQGTGEHSYFAMGYGEQYANFGATTYDWDNMIESYNSGATQEQKQAVATLMYHCGVAVDMDYAPDGSGAYSPDVPIAINTYFSYSDQATHIAKAGHTYDEWIALLKTNLDQYIPIYYSGHSSEGGHAFICDGYDTDGLFHFNWGWGGAYNNYFLIDGENFDYTGSQAIVYDFIPNYVYDGMPQTVTDLSVSIDSDVSRIGHLTWTNPTTTMSGNALNTIDKVIVKRNDVPVHEITGTAPGQTVNIDDEVPFFDQFEYTVHVVSGNNYGRTTKTKAVFGPYCDWKITMTSTSMQGWDGGGITVQNAAGSYIDFLTFVPGTPIQTFQMALGNNNLYWVEPNTAITNISFKVKDSENQVVYEYSGPSSDLEPGLIKTLNNSCGNENVCEAPYNLKATLDPENAQTVILTWESDHEPEFGYCIYRDGFLFNMAHETQYVDEHTNIGGHCYYVTSLCNGGETANSNEYCITSGTDCDEPTDLYFNYVGNKVQLTWSAPENTSPKGYIVYRKTEGTNYKEIKRLRQTTYKDTSAQPGVVYHYAVVAYYDDINCYSTYANNLFDKEKFYVEVDWAESPDIRLTAKVYEEAMKVTLFWEPVYQAGSTYNVMRNGVETIYYVENDVTYTDEDVETGGVYVYQVITTDQYGGWVATNEVEVVIGPNPVSCPAPYNFRRLSDHENKIRLTWSHPYEERIPDHFTVTIIDHLTGDTTAVDFPAVTNEYFQEDIDPNGMDKSYKVKAVYSDCESEYGLTEEGEDFIRIQILPCSAPTDFSGQILAPDSETRIIRLEWQAPEDRVPESYTLMEVVSYCATELQGITDTFYEREIPVDAVIDNTYMLYAVYPECQSELALTADGENSIHLTNLSVNEQLILNVKLYPNPTSGQLSIEAEEMTSVSLYDLVGQCVMQMSAEDGHAIVDMSQLQNGVYFVKVNTANGSAVQRVVKM